MHTPKLCAMSLYFYKFTQSKRGIVTSERPLEGERETRTKNIGGVTISVPVQSSGNTAKGKQGMKFGFTAIAPEAAAKMNLNVGDELPLELTDKQVISPDGEVLENLYWAH